MKKGIIKSITTFYKLSKEYIKNNSLVLKNHSFNGLYLEKNRSKYLSIECDYEKSLKDSFPAEEEIAFAKANIYVIPSMSGLFIKNGNEVRALNFPSLSFKIDTPVNYLADKPILLDEYLKETDYIGKAVCRKKALQSIPQKPQNSYFGESYTTIGLYRHKENGTMITYDLVKAQLDFIGYLWVNDNNWKEYGSPTSLLSDSDSLFGEICLEYPNELMKKPKIKKVSIQK